MLPLKTARKTCYRMLKVNSMFVKTEGINKGSAGDMSDTHSR